VSDPKHPGSLANPDTSAAFATATNDNPTSVALAPDGGIYYIAGGNGGELREISAISKPVIHASARQSDCKHWRVRHVRRPCDRPEAAELSLATG